MPSWFGFAPLLPYLVLFPPCAHPVVLCIGIGIGVGTHVSVDSLLVGVHIVVGNSVVRELDSLVMGC